jgi:cytochrome c biogenesis protein CcmG, thiol:disulfide interchange protein DsbE
VSGRRQLAIVLAGLGIVLALVFVVKHFLGDELTPTGIGIHAPDFTVVTLDPTPREQSLADYRGKVVMINIWATWCPPCRVEMPSIEQLHRTFGPKGLQILAVSVDEPGNEAAIRSFVTEYGLTFQILRDPKGQDGDVSRLYEATGYPETIIIGRDGIIRKKMIGASNWNSPENQGLIERLLDEKAD